MSTDTNVLIVAFVTATLLIIAGMVCVVWPKEIQNFANELNEQYRFVGRWNPFRSWTQTPQYVLMLRILGLFFGFVGIALLIISIQAGRQQ
ncbi:MAG: hypothetical protein AB7O65_14775 [Candidatus Korobacteraceae bacterium]